MSLAQEIATSQAVWAILCIALAGYVLRELHKSNANREESIVELYEGQKAEARQMFEDYKEDTKEREALLMNHLKRSNDSQEQTTVALQSINRTMITLEGRVDRIEKFYRGGDTIE